MNPDSSVYKGRPVYIVDGSRTPLLKAGITGGPFHAADLAVAASRSLLLRLSVNSTDLDEVIFGCVMPAADEANIARIIALRLACKPSITAWTVQRNCASGLQALDSAVQNISEGRADLVLAGGTEAMSLTPVLLQQSMVDWLSQWSRSRQLTSKLKTLASFRLSMLAPVIGLLRGLTDPVVGLSMGQTAENLAYRFGITRAQMDGYALQSHQRLAQAQDEGRLAEIVPLFDRRGQSYGEDTGLRRDSNLEQLSRLKPVFDKKFGLITAGNSAQVTDGAACLILASESAVERHGFEPMAKILDAQWAGLDPAQMGLGPVHAMTPIMQRHGLGVDAIDYWEINEAFAAQVLACIEAWDDDAYCQSELGLEQAFGRIPQDRLNVDGGGVSIGHPVGASGARIVLHLARTLQQRNARLGMASLCIGGGQGGAMLIENMTGEGHD